MSELAKMAAWVFLGLVVAFVLPWLASMPNSVFLILLVGGGWWLWEKSR